MDEVEVFSKNAAVRNAPWWDKLYVKNRAFYHFWYTMRM